MTSESADRTVALVTGGARGIGRAIAEALAADGHVVAVGDLDEDGAQKAAAELGGFPVSLDVTDSESVDAAVARVGEGLGAIGILVNNAGWDEFRPFLETDESFWDRVIEVNLKGCLRLCRRVVPGMVRAEQGRVVNIASDAARVGSSLEAVYSGAKGGVVSFTKTLAREVARHQVTVNAVCPGYVRAGMGVAMQRTKAGPVPGQAVFDRWVRPRVPLRRMLEPDEIAHAATFLALRESGGITGQALNVDGGFFMS